MGKGDSPRPIEDKDRYARNWDRIFGNEEGADINVAAWDDAVLEEQLDQEYHEEDDEC